MHLFKDGCFETQKVGSLHCYLMSERKRMALSEQATLPTTGLASSFASLVSFCHFKTSPEIIQITVMLYVRFPLSLRNLKDLLHERGVYVGYESVRY